MRLSSVDIFINYDNEFPQKFTAMHGLPIDITLCHQPLGI